MISVPSTFSISFQSDNLAKAKYRKIKQLASELLDLRNKLSQWTQEHLLECLDLSKFDYMKLTNKIVNHVSSCFYTSLQKDVYTAYSNRFDTIKHMMVCKLKVRTKTEYYKRDCKNGKKGTVKEIHYKSKTTDLTRTISMLAMYGELPSYKPETQRIIDKFGINRLLALAELRRKNVLNRYPEPITFKKLTFRGRSRLLADIVSKNRNKNSVIQGFVNISWGGKPITIPVKLHSKYHGDLQEYTKGKDTYYIIQVERKEVRVILTKDGNRYFPEVSLNENEIEGADVNVKHNMLVTTSGYEIKHNHELVSAIIKHEKETDRLKSEQEGYELGKRRQAKSDALSAKYVDYIEREAVKCCRKLHSKGIRHLVLENLQGCWGKTGAQSTDYGVNHNRISKAMHIASVKNTFLHIAPKYGIEDLTKGRKPGDPKFVAVRVPKPGERVSPTTTRAEFSTLHEAKTWVEEAKAWVKQFDPAKYAALHG